jgi:SAM-dependent methyltransferase
MKSHRKMTPEVFYSTKYNDLKDTRASDIYLMKTFDYLKRLKSRGKLLDVGCSYGDFGSRLMSLGFSVYGVDIRKAHLEASRKKGLITKYADVEKGLPFADSFFDVVFAGEIIEHLYDTTFFLKELSRVTRKGGLVIITTPNVASIQNRIQLLFGKLPGIVNHLEQSVGHIRYYTFSDLRKQMGNAGLKIIHSDTSNFPFPIAAPLVPAFVKKLAIKASRIAPTMGYQIIMVARK